MDGLRQSVGSGEVSDVGISEDFDPVPGQPVPQCREEGKGDDEVPDGAAADDENSPSFGGWGL